MFDLIDFDNSLKANYQLIQTSNFPSRWLSMENVLGIHGACTNGV